MPGKSETTWIQIERDRQLVKRMLANDDQAFTIFVEEYLPRLYRYARHRIDNEQDIEDIVQNALISATKHIESFRGESTLFTWLVSICRNEISRHLKKSSRARDFFYPFLNDDILRAIVESLESPVEDQPEARTLRDDMKSVIQLALDQLPEKYASVLEMKYIEGQSSLEIARQFNIGDSAVQSLLARARRAFREVCSESIILLLDQDDLFTDFQEKQP